MKLTVQPSNKLKDGLHEGVITYIEYREKPHEYTDIVIESDSTKVKVGYPTFISPDSKLGKLLIQFGVNLEVGMEIEPEFLVGKKCQFQSMTNEKGYPCVIRDTLKPLKVI